MFTILREGQKIELLILLIRPIHVVGLTCMYCNKVCIHLVIIFAYICHLIAIKITYSICLLIFKSANRRSERYVSPYYKKDTLVAA